ncbi:MAG: 2-hydroxyacyl-CoA dehydratase [Firmicutes bacterium]|nr:2-hydroxyacyl-CoA dehydratase [Bacillota bacterium]
MKHTGLKLPENFETYSEARQKSFLRMKQLKEESGAKIVGGFCSFIPKEIIYASGALPVGLCGSSEETIPAAEANLPRNLCPLIKSSYGGAVSDTCPFFYFSDLVVGETTCDGKMKMFELMNELKDTYVMQLPHSRSEESIAYFRQEILKFKAKLEDKFGVTITDEMVREAIRKCNEERRALRAFLETGMLQPAPVSGYELGTKVDAGSFSLDLDSRIESLKERTAAIVEDWEANYKGKPSDRPRLLVTGCPNTGAREKIIRAVEEMGADIVVYDNCGGIRNTLDLVDETNPDPYRALAEKYMKTNCSVMSPNEGRIEYMDWMIDNFHVDGVIEIILQSCHTYDVEAYYIKNFVIRKKCLPYLNIETDFSMSDKGQINTRLQAFLETIDR